MKTNSAGKPTSVEAAPAKWILAILLLLMAALILKNAWVSDDAYITFRSVSNVVEGYGPVYNVGERVQSYTHPLWMFLLIPFHAIFGELYYSSIFLSLALSLTAAYFILRQTANRWIAILAFAAMVGSKAFIDYATSGLENALSYVLLALFASASYEAHQDHRKLLIACLIASLAALSRLDSLLITLPILGYCTWRQRSSAVVKPLLLGFAPIIAWTLFSILYYGSPVANTAYAKLATGVAASQLMSQGIWYFADSLTVDPVTLIVVVAGVVLGLLSKHKSSLFLSIGVLLYLLYILRVGGDFMSGRFFTLPFVIALALVVRHIARLNRNYLLIAMITLLLLSTTSAKSNLLSGSRYGDVPLVQVPGSGALPLSLINQHGICDERGFYHQMTGLFRKSPGAIPTSDWYKMAMDTKALGPQILEAGAIGIFGYYAGPKAHIVDILALNDFFLARLPTSPKMPFRIGHYFRDVPDGYFESLASGRNQIVDPQLARFYDDVKLIVNAPLFASGRFGAIWRVNIGGDDHLIKSYFDRTY